MKKKSIMKFNDLRFQAYSGGYGGVQAKVFFPNGYGASIIRTPFSYGGNEGKYELAVLAGNESSHILTYSTSITDDVIGHLSERKVEKTLKRIARLPKRSQLTKHI